MCKVKICGIRREEDIEHINKYMPEFAGFIFAESRRRVSPENVIAITANLHPKIKKVGIFVNEGLEKVAEIANDCKLDIVQIHGDESPEYIMDLRKRFDLTGRKVGIWKAVRVKDLDSLRIMKDYSADAFVLDTYVEGSYGGAGKTFDWKLAVEAGKFGKIILAGGLTLENVREAVNIVHPAAVDVSSGVETDGFKDESKIRDFVCMIRNYEG